MTTYKTTVTENSMTFETLADILPRTGVKLKVLIIAKTPATKSVEVGHYFQGHHGKMFWSRLKDYNILRVRPGTFEDENLLENGIGLTDIVKRPRNFGSEPSAFEYKAGMDRISCMIREYKPKILIFVYKAVLDNILRWRFDLPSKSKYGFNPDLKRHLLSEVFVFPMPGTPCKKEEAIEAMNQLIEFIKKS